VFIQAAGNGNSGGGNTSLTTTLKSLTTAGSCLIAGIIWWNGSGQTISSVKDAAGNTFTSGITPQAVSNYAVTFYYLLNCAAGSPSVTAAFSSGTSASMIICEESGIALASAIDGTPHSASQTSTSWNSGNTATSNNTDVLYGFAATQAGSNVNIAPSGNWLSFDGVAIAQGNYANSSDAHCIYVERQFVQSTNSYAATGTCNNVLLAELVFALKAGLPYILTQPGNSVVNTGQTANLSVSAVASSGSLSYQWQQYVSGSWSNVGTNSSSYTTGAMGPGDDGSLFRVQVTDSNGTTTSTNGVVNVLGIATAAWLTS